MRDASIARADGSTWSVSLKRFLGCGWFFLPLLTTVWAAVLALYLFVWAVDPYELRWSKARERLADHAYPEPIIPRLAPAVAGDGTDLVVVGGSTAMGYTPAMMRAVFPQARHPFNLSYPCATGDDFALIFPKLERSRNLRRIIISLDFTLMWRCVSIDSPLDKRYYAPTWFEPVPEYDLNAVELSGRVLRTGLLDMPAWQQRLPDRVDFVNFAPPMSSSAASMASITHSVEAHRDLVTQGAPVSCAAIPALKTVVMPFIQRMSARGVSVDLLAPPYSLAFYSDWSDDVQAVRGNPPFARLMAIRRCALQMSAGVPHVRFSTFDTDLSVVADLSHYGDDGHLRDYAVYKYILTHIAAGDAILTAVQWPSFEARMKRELAAFKP